MRKGQLSKPVPQGSHSPGLSRGIATATYGPVPKAPAHTLPPAPPYPPPRAGCHLQAPNNSPAPLPPRGTTGAHAGVAARTSRMPASSSCPDADADVHLCQCLSRASPGELSCRIAAARQKDCAHAYANRRSEASTALAQPTGTAADWHKAGTKRGKSRLCVPAAGRQQ